ncbi:transposase [Streptomyces prasinus]|nr:transposase [Streptomyces prasinus]
MNAIFYQNRTGCRWRCLPHDLPAWSPVFYCFPLWREEGLDQQIQELLRRQVRERAERLEDPSRRGHRHPVRPRDGRGPGPRRDWTRTGGQRAASADSWSTSWA